MSFPLILAALSCAVFACVGIVVLIGEWRIATRDFKAAGMTFTLAQSFTAAILITVALQQGV